jgi:hypothetical protein
MPRPVLNLVAALLGLTAVTSFALGIVNAPEHGGRLPGERLPGQAGTARAIDATEATPLSQERIEGPPPAVEKPAAKTEEASDEAADAAAKAAAANHGPLLNVPPMATNAAPPEASAPIPSPDDEPPH